MQYGTDQSLQHMVVFLKNSPEHIIINETVINFSGGFFQLFGDGC
jgi:hypothetical protein